MASDIVEPDATLKGSCAEETEQNPPRHGERQAPVSSTDEIAFNLLVGQVPDPMLGPLTSSSDEHCQLISGAVPDPMLASHSVADAEPAEAIDSPEESTFSEFESIQTGAPLTKPSDRKPRQISVDEADDEEDDDDEDEAPARGNSLLVMLLASYASAVTLGLLWVLFSGRKLHETASLSDDGTGYEASNSRDPGFRADRSRVVTKSAKIPEANRTTLGGTLKLGDLEVTPLSVTEGPVELERTLTVRKTRKGGGHALKLRLRFRNISQSAIFAPLDEGFIRERLRAAPESFVESNTGEPILTLYPLAVESEWSIVGQVIRELGPQQSFESLIVTEPDALGRVTPEMVWRVRLRIGINETADLGLIFRANEIQGDRPPKS